LQVVASLKVDTITSLTTTSVLQSIMQDATDSQGPDRFYPGDQNDHFASNHPVTPRRPRHCSPHPAHTSNQEADWESLLNDPYSKVTCRRGARPLDNEHAHPIYSPQQSACQESFASAPLPRSRCSIDQGSPGKPAAELAHAGRRGDNARSRSVGRPAVARDASVHAAGASIQQRAHEANDCSVTL
jgi:hypothetical protein